MNQSEQVAHVTPLEAATKAIFGLQKQVTVQKQRITKLEQRIEQLDTCATLNAETVWPIAGLQRIVAEQGERIENLEGRWRVLQHNLLNFSAGATYTAEHAKQIEDWSSGSRR